MPGVRSGQRPTLDVDNRAGRHWRCRLIKSFVDEAVQEEQRNQRRANEETEEFLRPQEVHEQE